MGSVDRWLRRLAAGDADAGEIADLDRCRAVREELSRSDDLVGDVFEARGSDVRLPVANQAHRASVPQDKGRILYRMVRNLRPGKVVEFGSAMGVSGGYLAAAIARNGAGELVTIEGSPSRSALARRSIEAVAPGVTRALCAFFDDRLEELSGAELFFLDGNHYLEPTLGYVDAAVARMSVPAVLVLDDVAWSDEMASAWRRLRPDRRFSGHGGACGMGVLALGDVAEIRDSGGWWRRSP